MNVPIIPQLSSRSYSKLSPKIVTQNILLKNIYAKRKSKFSYLSRHKIRYWKRSLHINELNPNVFLRYDIKSVAKKLILSVVRILRLFFSN